MTQQKLNQGTEAENKKMEQSIILIVSLKDNEPFKCRKNIVSNNANKIFIEIPIHCVAYARDWRLGLIAKKTL